MMSRLTLFLIFFVCCFVFITSHPNPSRKSTTPRSTTLKTTRTATTRSITFLSKSSVKVITDILDKAVTTTSSKTSTTLSSTSSSTGPKLTPPPKRNGTNGTVFNIHSCRQSVSGKNNIL